MATLGFGSYRIADGNFAHEQALRYALQEGITLIDTSTNYTAGLSETLIGRVIRDFDRSKLRIISKYGYIQGEKLKKEKAEPKIPDCVKYDEHCYHSIAATFLQEELTQSLNRLGLEYIDTYLIHNPEYYLLHTIQEPTQKKRQQELMLQRIYEAFCALEEEVKKGRIKSYGISSNSFALSEEDLHFLPYKDLKTLAKSAAKYVKNAQDHFTTIQLPVNLLEQEGLTCAAWAKSVGLEVVANRPLNAFKEGLSYRLATYERPLEYERILNETLHFFEQLNLSSITNLISELDAHVHKFGFVGDYEAFMSTQVFPILQKSFQSIDEHQREQAASVLEYFLEYYQKMVAYEASKTTLSSLHTLKVKIEAPIQKHALKFLLQNSTIDVVLLGMRRTTYVQEALALM